jgi:pyruvate/2-oxoglutarate dehydrogenase complex dihydrolipoamide acyltransferase (E2) component
VDVTTELPGRLEAIRTAQVRARVTGVVKRRLFTEGSVVKAGQSLFEIDPVPYRAALDSALATEAKAEAVLMQAQATLDRNRPWPRPRPSATRTGSAPRPPSSRPRPMWPPPRPPWCRPS